VSDPARRLSAAQLAFLRDAGARALEALRPAGPGGEVRARIIGDREMADLHARTLGDPATTDVLTFDLAGEPSAPLDVDLALCADEARRQASARGGAVEHELLLYLVHGALHCMGFDDRDDAGARAMHQKEDEVLRAVGVGPVFAPPGAGARP